MTISFVGSLSTQLQPPRSPSYRYHSCKCKSRREKCCMLHSVTNLSQAGMISIDVGTGGIKAGILLQDGSWLPNSCIRVPYAPCQEPMNPMKRKNPTIKSPTGNISEQSTGSWVHATSTAIQRLEMIIDQNLYKASRLQGIALTGHMQDMILLDEYRNALYNGQAILYDDSRAEAEAQELAKALQLPISSVELLSKFLWMDRNDGKSSNQTCKVLFGAHSYIVSELCEAQVCDAVTAWTTGLYQLSETDSRMEPISAKLNHSDIKHWKSKLPGIVSPSEPVGFVQNSKMPSRIIADLPVFHSLGDAGSTTFGAGAGNESCVHVYIGTSGWIGGSFRRSIGPRSPDANVFYLPHPNPELQIVLGSMTTAGGALDWCRQVLSGGSISFEAMNQLVAQSDVGANGVIFLPHIRGERCPFSNPKARGAFVNLSGHNTQSDMFRAAYEGVALNLSACYKQLLKIGCTLPSTVTMTGGGALSPVFAQIVADVLGVTIQILDKPDFVAVRGAALLALGNNVPGPWPGNETIHPNMETHIKYQSLYETCKGLHVPLYEYLDKAL